MKRALFSLIFAAATAVLGGLALATAYETLAIWTGAVPTISAITAGQLLAHPSWFVPGVFLFGVLTGSLITHFTHWTPAARRFVARQIRRA